MKIELHTCVISIQHNSTGGENLCKSGKDYLTASTGMLRPFLYKILKLLIFHTSFYDRQSLSYQH